MTSADHAPSSWPRLPEGFSDGLVAGCVLVTVELAARVLFIVRTLPELIQDRLVQILPGPVFAWVLPHLLYLGKPSLFVGLLVAQVVAGGFIGVLYARWRQPLLLALGMWLLTGLLLVPLTRKLFFGGHLGVAI